MTNPINYIKQKFNTGISYYLTHYKSLLLCRTEFLGTKYGGWTICPDGISETSIMYSLGVGEDASFDLDVIARYGVEVHAFDPTPRSIDWVKRQSWPTQFRFYPYGIGSSDQLANFFPPENPEWVSHTILPRSPSSEGAIQVQLLRLETVTKMLMHKEIDILKMDIEGAEYEVIDDLLQVPAVRVRQILVEFHHWLYPKVSMMKTITTINKLEKAGYKLFNISEKGIEFSFIRM